MAGRETPAIKAAARAGIRCQVLEYEHDPGSGSSGLEAAERLGLDPERVFKTLLATVDGISPLGQRKRIRTLLDDAAFEHETIFVSAGRRGLEIELAALTGADTMALARR